MRKSATTDGQKRSETDIFGAASTEGNGPNTVSESTVSNTELSEFFGAN